MSFQHVILGVGCEHEYDANVFSPASQHSVEATWRWRLKFHTKLCLS